MDFRHDIVEGVKVTREDEQIIIKEMLRMREAGVGYRDIAAWMAETQVRKMSFMGVKRTLLAAAIR